MPRTLNIPSAWLMGMSLRGYTVAEAVAYWLEQDRLLAQWTAEHADRVTRD